MHRTIFDTPIVNTLLRWFSVVFLRLAGWRALGCLPPGCHKSVLIAAPHTSNWDLPFALFAAFSLRLPIYWMGKHTIFSPPFRHLMMWLGGIPVDRSKANNLVAESAQALKNAAGPLHLVVPPEGTRSKVRKWKSGFYYIALSAEVPIVMAYIDYEKRVVGIGPVFTPTGNLDADMDAIKAFYAAYKGKNPHQF